MTGKRPLHATYYDIEAIHSYNIDIPQRELYLCGEPESCAGEEGDEPGVEFIMANRLVANIRYLANQDAEKPILIHMKTGGGYWTEGMAIYDAIVACPCPVHILNYSHARSMSSIIFQAADWRAMMPSSYFMFHFGEIGVGGELRAVASDLDFTRRVDTPLMLGIYARAIQASKTAKFAKWSVARITGYLERQMEKKSNVYLTAPEAVEWGFADAVFDGDWNGLVTK